MSLSFLFASQGGAAVSSSGLCTQACKAVEPLLPKSLTNAQVPSAHSQRKIHAPTGPPFAWQMNLLQPDSGGLSGSRTAVDSDQHCSIPRGGLNRPSPRPAAARLPPPPTGLQMPAGESYHTSPPHSGLSKSHPLANTKMEKVQGIFYEPSTLPISLPFYGLFRNS